jgi:hypothetical protein
MRWLIQTVFELMADGEFWLPALGLMLIGRGMSDTVTTDRGPAMLAVIEEIVAEAEGLIRDWPLLGTTWSEGSRAMWIRAPLQANGLEPE